MTIDILDYIRNEDAFTDPYDYILNQLFIYSYSNPTNLQILFMKIWVLDGKLTKEEETGVNVQLGISQIISNTLDNDYDNPKNHYAWLQNELIFLDRYIRTQQNALEEGENDFNELKAGRKLAEQALLQYINPNTNKPYQKFEIDYALRNTYLTNLQFENLYKAWVTKNEDGELAKVSDIIPSSKNLNNELVLQEYKIEAFTEPNVVNNSITSQANTNKLVDDIYVEELNNLRDKALNMIVSLYDNYIVNIWQPNTYYIEGERVLSSINVLFVCEVPHLSSGDGDTGSSITNFTEYTETWTSDTYYIRGDIVVKDNAYYICKIPHNSTANLDIYYWSSFPFPAAYHKWRRFSAYTIDDEIGYRGHVYKCLIPHIADNLKLDINDGKWQDIDYSSEVIILNFPQARVKVKTIFGDPSHKGVIMGGGGYRFSWLNLKGKLKPLAEFVDIFGDPESWNTDTPDHGWYNEGVDSTWEFNQITRFPNENEERIQWGTEWDLDNWEIVHYKDNGTITNPGGIDGLIYGEDLDIDQILTFVELSKRWATFNNLREDEVKQTGSRLVIESMSNASIPDLSVDIVNFFQTLKDEKVYLTMALKEKCPEF